ncbi:hypothetical protein AGLY_011241 [Aphis glycines]|uniref:Uncharacterized protein n=1 Tax=Aphis glycines TaxID=307491 RepID=A0A6G0TD27_APHGL|nr:hypothetical protein AGLY_011241 [Aphis glycines]
MEAGIKTFCYFVNQSFYTMMMHDNLGLQIAYNAYNIINTDSADFLLVFPTQDSNKKAPKTDITKPASVTVAVPPQSVSPTMRVPKTKKQNPAVIMYNKHEVDESLSFGFEVPKTDIIKLASVTVAVPPQSVSPTMRVPKTKKQNPAVIMYNKYEVDESLSFGFDQVDQHLLIDSVNDSPIEYNYEEVVLFVKQAWQDVEKMKIDGKSNILEYK